MYEHCMFAKSAMKNGSFYITFSENFTIELNFWMEADSCYHVITWFLCHYLVFINAMKIDNVLFGFHNCNED